MNAVSRNRWKYEYDTKKHIEHPMGEEIGF